MVILDNAAQQDIVSEVGCGGVRKEVGYKDAPCIRNKSHINRIPPAVKFHILLFDQPHFFQLPQEPVLSVCPSRLVVWSVGLSVMIIPCSNQSNCLL